MDVNGCKWISIQIHPHPAKLGGYPSRSIHIQSNYITESRRSLLLDMAQSTMQRQITLRSHHTRLLDTRMQFTRSDLCSSSFASIGSPALPRPRSRRINQVLANEDLDEPFIPNFAVVGMSPHVDSYLGVVRNGEGGLCFREWGPGQ